MNVSVPFLVAVSKYLALHSNREEGCVLAHGLKCRVHHGG